MFAIQVLKSLPSSVKQIRRRTERDFPTVQINTSHIYSTIPNPNRGIRQDKIVLKSLPFRTSLDSKLREFQYKILNNIVFTNDKLFRFGLSQSPNCTFCNEEPESLEHLLSRSKVSSEFWKEVLSWLKENNIVIEPFGEIGFVFRDF